MSVITRVSGHSISRKVYEKVKYSTRSGAPEQPRAEYFLLCQDPHGEQMQSAPKTSPSININRAEAIRWNPRWSAVVLVHPGPLQWLSELWHSQHVPWCSHVTHPSQGSGKMCNRMKWVSWRAASSGTQSLKSSFSEHGGRRLQPPAPLSLWQCRPLCATASNFVGNSRDLDCIQFVLLVGDESKILLNAMMVRVSVSQRLFSWTHQGQTSQPTADHTP